MDYTQRNNQFPEWVLNLFGAIDRYDVDAFMAHLSPNVAFGFDGRAMANGQEEARAFVENYIGGFDCLEHEFEECVSQGATTVVRGRITYRIDGKGDANAGWTVFFHVSDSGLVDEYLIYMDPMPLLTLQGRLS